MAVYLCPDCDSEMVLRKNKQTSEEFWGCSRYPKCTGTRAQTGAGKDDPDTDDLPSERYRRADRSRWRD